MTLPPAQAQSTVTADFAVGADAPLLKDKFDLYSTAIPDAERFEQDSTFLYALPAESLRLEYNWGDGQTLSGAVGGAWDRPRYDRSLPDRRQVTVRGAALEAAASSAAHRASVLVLNRTGAAHEVRLVSSHVPFERGSVRVYRIDKDHCSYGDGAGEALTPVQTTGEVATARWEWAGAVPSSGTLYVEATGSAQTADFPPRAPARLLRINRYYPSRGTSAFSDFDARTWVARLGMGGEQQADQQVGVTAGGLPDVLEFEGACEGVMRDAHGLLGVRLDFAGGHGYSRSVLFHGPWGPGAGAGRPDLYHLSSALPVPFGTQRPPGRAVRVPDMAHFRVRAAAYAPPDWTGRTQITFVFQNAGAGGRRGAAGYGSDAGYAGGNAFGVAEPVTADAVAEAAPLSVYQNERGGGIFWYTVGALQPGRLYKVRLHFAEFYWKEPGKRLFDVALNGLEVFETLAPAPQGKHMYGRQDAARQVAEQTSRPSATRPAAVAGQ